jgi:hypothetical protein
LPATDPLSLGIAAAATLVAVAAGYVQRRRTPDLDGERWLKVTLATLLRGQVEAEGGDADAWERAVRSAVWWHPAGRRPEQKIAHPGVRPPGPLLEGEEGLLQALGAVDDIDARWALLYDRDEEARAALLDDPFELGPNYAPSAAAHPSATWDDVARWGAGDDPLKAQLLDRLDATWVLLGGTEPRLVEALAEELPDATVLAGTAPAPMVEAFERLLHRADTRLVLVAEGDAVPPLLQVLVDHAGLRDQVVAVVSVGGVIGGRTDVSDGPLSAPTRFDWNERWFGQEHLDTGVVRLTPYMSLQWLDRTVWPPGIDGLPLAHQRFGEPAMQAATAVTIESVDLGVMPHRGGASDRQLARALVVVVCGWVASRR